MSTVGVSVSARHVMSGRNKHGHKVTETVVLYKTNIGPLVRGDASFVFILNSRAPTPDASVSLEPHLASPRPAS